ncbi:MAG: ABC transporter substrate-binding protein, partial [Burkholderiaceae bacterium]|nr:ABC transporter substrate-binding protein [Burkholderiaceae bacterium]
FEAAVDKSDKFFLDLQREATDKMAEAYKKSGAKVIEMSKADFDAWVALAKKTSYPEYESKSPLSKELLALLMQVQ